MYGLSGLTKNLNYVNTLNEQNYINSMESCVQQMYGLSVFAENLNIQNYVNAIGNCVHQMYRLT